MRRGPLVAAGMLLLTFTVGALAGMAAEEAFGLDWFDFFEEARRRDAEGDRLLAGLSLTVVQQARAEEILERQEDRLEDYWEARLPEIGGLTEQSQREIRALLTPTQQAVFDHRVRELDGRVPAELRED
jgi:Spy/CpxP family protein refolding chaperone